MKRLILIMLLGSLTGVLYAQDTLKKQPLKKGDILKKTERILSVSRDFTPEKKLPDKALVAEFQRQKPINTRDSAHLIKRMATSRSDRKASVINRKRYQVKQH